MKDKKFKIGDRVRAIGKVDGVDLAGTTGTVINIDNNIKKWSVQVEFDENINGHNSGGKGKMGHCRHGAENEFELIPKNNKKIVITSDGVETLAKLYEGNKVVKSATAKCSPHDEYNFETGAKIAFDRLTGNEEKPKYKAGDKVRVIANTCYHFYAIGKTLTLKEQVKKIVRGIKSDAWHVEEGYRYVTENDIEPYTEPEYFTGKVVCVKSSWKYNLTVGKVYNFSSNNGCGENDGGGCILEFPRRSLNEINCAFTDAKFLPLVE